MKIKHDKEHFLSCNVAAFTYCEGVEVFSQLKVGKKVRLVREDENPHDHKAVAIFFGDAHIGYIPRQQNETISKFLDLGYAAEGAGPLANHGSRKPLSETVAYL